MNNAMQMTDADRRANQSRAIVYRDEYLALAIELRGRADATDANDLRAIVDLHTDIVTFLDGVLCRSFPGVAARLRSGLQACGWTWAWAMECLAAYNALPRSAVNGEVIESGKCERCGGAGRISAYSHVSGGECFDCGGSGLADDTE